MTQVTSTDAAARYVAIQQRATAVNAKRIKIETELSMLRQEHKKTVDALKELGVTDLSNVSELLATKEQELEQLITDVETSLTTAEDALAQLNT